MVSIIEKISQEFILENKKLLFFYLLVLLTTIPLEIYLLPKYFSFFITNLNKVNLKSNFLNTVAPILTVLFLVMGAVILRTSFENRIIPKFVIFTRKWIYRYILSSHTKSFSNLGTTTAVSILSEFPQLTKNILVSFVRIYVPYILSFVFIIAFFLYVDLRLGLLQIMTLLFISMVFYFKGKQCINISEDAHKNYLSLTETIQDKLENLVAIYSSQMEDSELKKNIEEEKINEDYYLKTLNCSLQLEFYSNSITFVSFVIFNYLLYILVRDKKVTTETVISLYICEVYYWIILLRRIENGVGDIMNGFGSLKAIMGNLGTMEGNSKKKGDKTKRIAKNAYLIETVNASFKYPNNDSYIIKNLNLKIKKGEKILLSGHSGVGKSTLIKLLMGFFPPTEGDIYIGSEKLNTKHDSIEKIRREISFLNQDTKLFKSTLFENMTYGSTKNVEREDVLWLLKSMNISIFDKLSNGLDTEVDVGGESLSGGQKQITLLFRLYFREANIILMDEPISAIDANSLPEVLRVIKYISKEKTLLLISHSDKIKPIITRVIHLK
jgi:ABC-type multidrug transport system fused ATPase/permease subunit